MNAATGDLMWEYKHEWPAEITKILRAPSINRNLAIYGNGQIVWYYQHLVDHWDFDHPFERLLVDTVVAPSQADVSWINPRIRPGERRKVITGVPGKTGVVYTLDRQTGEFLWAKPTVMQNVITKI